MMLSTAVESFIDWKIAEGYSTGTVSYNRTHLYRVIEILGDIPVVEFNARAFDRVQAVEFRRGLSPGTLNNMTAAVRAFTKWAHQREVMARGQDPSAGRRQRPDPPKEKMMMSVSTFPVLLDAAPIPRDRMLIAIAIFTMARQGELTTLKVKDIDLEAGTVYLKVHKSNIDDRMPISSELDRELRRWLIAYSEECGPLDPEWFLLPARTPFRGRRTTPEDNFGLVPTRKISRPTDILHRAMNVLGIEQTRYQDGMHMLRRSSARVLYNELAESGYDGAMRQVQTWLHHASIQTTERYLGLTVDKDTRDKNVRGKPLFPSLQGGNIVGLEARRGERNAS